MIIIENIYYGFPCSMEEGHSKRRDFMCGMGFFFFFNTSLFTLKLTSKIFL